VAGPFCAIATAAPPSNKAAAKPIRADLVMIVSVPIPQTTERTFDRRRLFQDWEAISKVVGHTRTDGFALTLDARRSAVAEYDSRL
jgi:hypothetical protein